MPASVEDIIQHTAYDPAARRERYLASRKLKGRQPGDGNAEVHSIGSAPSLKTKTNQAASQTRQVAALQARLSSLRAQLQKLLAEAGTSSSSTDSSTSSEKKGGSNAGDKPLSAKEKADARVASEKYRKTHPDKTAPDKTKKPSQTKEEQIAHIRAVIQDVRAKLRAAIESARTQTASNGR